MTEEPKPKVDGLSEIVDDPGGYPLPAPTVDGAEVTTDVDGQPASQLPAIPRTRVNR